MKLKVTQIRSTIGRKQDQKRTIIALGLGKISRSRMHDDNPVIRGMINKVSHLVKVEEIKEEPVRKVAPVKLVTKKALPKTEKPEIKKKIETKPAAKKTVKTEEVKKVEPKKSTAKKTMKTSTKTTEKKTTKSATKPATKKTTKPATKTQAKKTTPKKTTTKKTASSKSNVKSETKKQN